MQPESPEADVLDPIVLKVASFKVAAFSHFPFEAQFFLKASW
jgi:hypothetical protein